MRILCLVPALLLAGCVTTGAHTTAVDVRTIEKPVPVPCRIAMPKAPVPHVALVQLTGDAKRDMVLIARAMEAELGERIAYEIKFEAAALKCMEAPAQ